MDRVALAFLGFCLISGACGAGDGDARLTPESTRPSAAASPTLPIATVATPPTQTPTVETIDCSINAAACAFAREIAALMATGQYDEVVKHTRISDHECPGPEPKGAGGPFPLCRGAQPGEQRSGYVTAGLQSEGGVVSRADLVETLRGWVERADPADTTPVLATIGCPLVDRQTSCGERFAIVLGLATDRFLLRFGVLVDKSGQPGIAQTVTGIISINQQMASGGDDEIPVVFGIEENVGTRYFLVP